MGYIAYSGSSYTKVGLTSIPHGITWSVKFDEIIYIFSDFKSAPIVILELVSEFILHFTMGVISFPCRECKASPHYQKAPLGSCDTMEKKNNVLGVGLVFRFASRYTGTLEVWALIQDKYAILPV